MAVKTPAPPSYSKGFNLQDAFLGVIGSGQYDNVLVSNGSQKVQLTKFGGTGQTPEAIHLQGGGQNLSLAPITAGASSVSVGASGKLDIQQGTAAAAAAALSPTTLIVLGIAGVGLLMLLTMRKKS